MRKVKKDELKKVNGGWLDQDETTCPKCGDRFDAYSNTVSYGTGCNEKTYFKCPCCDYEFNKK